MFYAAVVISISHQNNLDLCYDSILNPQDEHNITEYFGVTFETGKRRYDCRWVAWRVGNLDFKCI